MANPPRAKGTRWESELLILLRAIWPHAERAPLKGNADCGDFLAVGDYLFEAKSVTVPRILEWARTCRTKAHRHGREWIIAWHGDRRDPRGQPLAVMDLALALRLLALEASLERAEAVRLARVTRPDGRRRGDLERAGYGPGCPVWWDEGEGRNMRSIGYGRRGWGRTDQ